MLELAFVLETVTDQKWFSEVHGEAQSLGIKVKEVLYHKKSKYQDILVFESEMYGTVLALDHTLMLSDVDEHMYHLALTTYGMQNVTKDKDLNVLVIGAGDGGVVRNLLRNFGVRIKHIDMVEIDEDVITVSKEFFPEIACEFDNPKLSVRCEDAIAFVRNAQEAAYDLVLCDSTDPEGFAAGLIEEDFYKDIQRILSPAGIFCAQSGSPFFQKAELKKTQTNMGKVFAEVHSFYGPMTVYPGGFWSYTAAGNKIINKENIDLSKYVKN